MDVQIFGTAKCKDTRKAQRFFKERRVGIHFVDLSQKSASPRELERFARKYGTEALLDREGKRFRDRGLHVAHLPEAKIIPLLVDDPLLIRTPLVRRGNDVTVGLAEDEAVPEKAMTVEEVNRKYNVGDRDRHVGDRADVFARRALTRAETPALSIKFFRPR